MTLNLGPAILIGAVGCGIIYAVFKHLSLGGKMNKADVVAAAVAAVQAGQVQVLSDQFGSVFDQAEASGNGPGFTQADIDKAVAAQKAADQVLIDAANAQDGLDVASLQAAKDALSAAQGQILDLGKQLAASGDKLTADEGVINGFKGSIEQLKGLLAQLEAIIIPAPVPAPAPAA